MFLLRFALLKNHGIKDGRICINIKATDMNLNIVVLTEYISLMGLVHDINFVQFFIEDSPQENINRKGRLNVGREIF